MTIDTNYLAPGFLQVNEESVPVQLVNSWVAGLFTLVISEHILEELQRTFAKPYFARRMSVQQQAANLALLRTLAVITPLAVTLSGVATHPEDDLVLATALSGNAQFLVTGDYKLISLKQYQGLILVTAHEFLATLPGLTNQEN